MFETHHSNKKNACLKQGTQPLSPMAILKKQCVLHEILYSLFNLLAHLSEPVIGLPCLDLRHFFLRLQVCGTLLLQQSLQLIDSLCNMTATLNQNPFTLPAYCMS
jgi:hypothetical protein